jgi:PII-like signaling protein
MLKAGKALKVCIYLSEGSRHHGVATESSILDFLFTHSVSGATVFKGVAGFGVDHHLHSASFVELSDKLPVKIEFVETEEKVDELLPKLMELAGTGMIDVLETTIVKAAGAVKAASPAGNS